MSQLMEVALLGAKLVGVAVALLFAYAVAIFVQHIWRLRGFKGPLAIPVLGNAWNPRIVAFMRFLIELRQKYGPIFTFFALTQGYLVCADPVIVRRILSDPKTFTKGSSYRDYFHIVFGDGLVTSNGEKHKADRAIFGKYFIRSNINRYVPRINEMARGAVKDLERKYKENPEQNVEKFFAVLALHVFMNLACSCDFPRDRDLEYAKLISKGSYLVGQLIGLGLPLWDIVPQVNYLRRHKEREFDWYSGFVEDRKKALARGEVIDDILTAMLTNNLTQVEIGDHLTTMISAGHDTTTFFLSYFCYLVARNQDVQDKVRAELLEVFGDSEEVTPEAISELKYLPKVMMETLRMYAVIPSITRLATEDITFAERNITIRKGTEVIIPLYIMNRDPELWDNPAEFNPDRFEESKQDYTSASKGFFPFAYGTRTCIGNTLAQIESSIFLAHILRKFRLLPADGYKPDIRAGISLTTSNGVKVKLQPL